MPQDLEPGCDVLMDAPMARRGKAILSAMTDLANVPQQVRVISQPPARPRRLLMMYGVGLPARHAIAKAHRRAGGRVVMWDLGYFERERCMRLAVDSLHPTPEQIALAPPVKRGGGAVSLRNDANPAGPIMIVGIGPKSCALYGLRHQQWERQALQWARDTYPGRAILWRPKGRDRSPLPGAEMVAGIPIEQALKGCALVLARHSNVAIDACIAGVPVRCEDGAAHALYGYGLEPPPALQYGNAPPPALRADFLARLSWFNWAPDEAYAAWTWIWRLTE